jgi:hypothetical protein
MIQLYDEIIALQDEADAPLRGYRFEQVIRELLPWERRPPIAISAQSEQIDGIFVWNGSTFLVEAKAKNGKILAGSHDWEDFELKVRRRHGGVVGLFCSLGPVAPGVIEAANHLNRDGHPVVIIEGTTWNDLGQARLSIEDYLAQAILEARTAFRCRPRSVQSVLDGLRTAEKSRQVIADLCLRHSATFLRRYKSEHHTALYVQRTADENIEQFIRALRPSKLNRTHRIDSRTGLDLRRRPPTQILVIKDSAGAGKTTLAVELASKEGGAPALVRAATEPSVDAAIEWLDRASIDRGLRTLELLDWPLVVVVDSLDEAQHDPGKRSEVLALVRAIDAEPSERTFKQTLPLNSFAVEQGLLAYPILLIFTVREDYWDRWQTVFEGRQYAQLTNSLSRFSRQELNVAISKYEKVFGFRINGTLSEGNKELLSVPFNLRVFAEAYSYQGAISIGGDTLPEHVLARFFRRKSDDILKRRIPGLGRSQVMSLLSATALQAVSARSLSFPKRDFLRLVRQTIPMLRGYEDEVALAFISDQLLDRDIVSGDLRFPHYRFAEYLVAYSVLNLAEKETAPRRRLDDLSNPLRDVLRDHSAIAEVLLGNDLAGPVLSPFRVHDCMRYLAAQEFPHLKADVENYYGESQEYMRRNIGRLRLDAAHGHRTDNSDLEFVAQNSVTSSPELLWEGFFLLASRVNQQSKEVLLAAFKRAWVANVGKAERWKLLERLRYRTLFLHEDVLVELGEKTTAKEWEVLLGLVLEYEKRADFRRVANIWNWSRRSIAMRPSGNTCGNCIRWWNLERNMFLGSLKGNRRAVTLTRDFGEACRVPKVRHMS